MAYVPTILVERCNFQQVSYMNKKFSNKPSKKRVTSFFAKANILAKLNYLTTHKLSNSYENQHST